MRLYEAAELTLGLLLIPLVGLLVQELAVVLFPALLVAQRHRGTNGISKHPPVGLRNISDLAKFTWLLPGSKSKLCPCGKAMATALLLPSSKSWLSRSSLRGLQSSKRAFSHLLKVPLRCPWDLEGLQAEADPKAHLGQTLARAASLTRAQTHPSTVHLAKFPLDFCYHVIY